MFLSRAVLLPLLLLVATCDALLLSQPLDSPDTLIRVLVADFLAIRETTTTTTITTHSVFQNSEYQLREKEIKDRYELLFQLAVRSGGKEDQEQEVESLALALDRRHRKTFIATWANWKLLLSDVLPGFHLDFLAITSRLRAAREELVSVYDPHAVPFAGPPLLADNPTDFNADVWAPDFRIDLLPERTADTEKYFRIFNVSYLPTHSDLIEVFSWLNPTAVEPELPDPKFLQNVASEENLSYLTPLDWIFFFSNHPNKVCEVFTQEYVRGLADYLAHRIASLLEGGLKKVTITDIGAGNGRLTHFLKVSFYTPTPHPHRQ